MVEKINRHIEKLLAMHDYVVVPKLGGFVVQQKPALILSQSISPPLHVVGFNPLMIHSDGLLALEIARTESISFRAAMELIETEVANIKSQLQNSGNYTIGELGILSITQEGRTLFTPIYKADFLPANYGLYDLNITKRQSNPDRQGRELTFKLPSVSMYKYAAAAMLIFGLLFFAPELNDTRRTQNSDFSTLVTDNKTNFRTELQQSTDSTVAVADDGTASYHLIVSSLPNRALADKFCTELKSGNYLETHVLVSEKNFRVAIQSFHNLDTAIQHMENLRLSDSRFETAWVYCE